jgi:hypothetical protein
LLLLLLLLLPILDLLLNAWIVEDFVLEVLLEVLLQPAAQCRNCGLPRSSLQPCPKLCLKLSLDLRFTVQDGSVCVADTVNQRLRHGTLPELCALGSAICSSTKTAAAAAAAAGT